MQPRHPSQQTFPLQPITTNTKSGNPTPINDHVLPNSTTFPNPTTSPAPAITQQSSSALTSPSTSVPFSRTLESPSSSPPPGASYECDHLDETGYALDSNVAAHSKRKKMSKAPLLIRPSPGFGTGSYGAAPINPEIGDEEDDFEDSTEQPARPSTDAGYSRRRKSGSTHRSPTFRTSTSSLSHRRSLSEEVGGSTATTGLEGRFGLTETTPLSNDALSDAKSNISEASDEQSGDDDDDQITDEDPPDNSPYPQVRASVSPTDNTSLSINTPRMWTLSVLFSIIGSSTNLFFSLRYPSVAITPVIALLLVHPLGLIWDYALKRPDDPREEFIDGVRTSNSSSNMSMDSSPKVRNRRQRFRLWLAQGSWNEKEHSCVYVSSNVSFGFAFATDVIVEQTQFYNQPASILYQLLLTLSTQILGYTFAGLTRRFLVRPSGMIWPGTLMSAAMFTTLHKEENKPANGWRISRWKFFYVIWLSAFLFYFLPGLLMPALSYFNVITWFAPDNVVVANLFGVVSGLGLFPLTFDWAQIAYIGSPLLTPFWAAMNVIGGLVIVMWIIAPIGYYCNLFYSSYMPMLSASVFDNTGKVYDVGRILTPDFVFDREAYSNYSRVFMPITYVLSYGLQFAGLASLLTHTACWHGKDIWTQWRRSLKEAGEEGKPAYQPLDGEGTGMSPLEGNSGDTNRLNPSGDGLLTHEDVHNRLMRRYKDAPITWYLITFVSMTAVGIFVVE